ncbi:MAG: hypothetical protein AAF899_17705, partial [Pseudomonadota bacterium]
VGGAGGIDRNLVAIKASRDETVTVSRPGQGAGGPVAVNVTIMANDPRAFAASRGQISRQLAAAVGEGMRLA